MGGDTVPLPVFIPLCQVRGCIYITVILIDDCNINGDTYDLLLPNITMGLQEALILYPRVWVNYF